MRTSLMALAAFGLAANATPALAEIVEARADHFVTRNEAVVEATPKETWLALISPARWWSSEHTWSADAANLKLTPQAGGCFCETIPEVSTPDRFTLEGSVEHMRVVQAYPEVALRMVGALGPLQSEPVTGVLTIAISEVEGGTRIVWEYNVGGKMRFPPEVIGPAVDGVMTLQLTRLAETLGTVVAPTVGQIPADEEPAPEAEEDVPATIDPQDVLEAEPEEHSAVDEAFGDLSEDG
ncbi:MAG: SRPBCC family protein [Erythrobacter sp.]